MAIPRAVARFNARVTNRVTRPLAGRLPGFGIVSHVGRRSGRIYRTPVNVFRDGDHVIALTYGAESDWVKNVIAAAAASSGREDRRFGCPTHGSSPIRAGASCRARFDHCCASSA